MRYLALATDGDGTLMRAGHMARTTVAALKRWRAAGRKLILVTGERPQELCDFPHLELFDVAVAENGGLLMDCQSRKERRLAPAPPQSLIRALRKAHVKPIKVGRSIIQTDLANEHEIDSVLAADDADWQLVANRKQLMIVPAGVDKATGLRAALAELHISPTSVVAVGDAENDIALLECAGLGVAVRNAVPRLKQHAALVTKGRFGRGAVELIDRLLRGRAISQNRRSA